MVEQPITVLFGSSNDDPIAWYNSLRDALPTLELKVWPDVGNPDLIEVALVWDFEHGKLKELTNLKGIISLGAGVEHLLSDPTLPTVPIARIVDPVVTSQMCEYAIYSILRHHRLMPTYEGKAHISHWDPLPPPATDQATVGILGLGSIGLDLATKLRTLGFPVCGWSRTQRSLPDVSCFSGKSGLYEMLSHTNMLVCILPLTPATHGIINIHTLAALPKGAYIINFARGGHVVESDLLSSIQSGHISGAMLDVFTTEPLPKDHPFWANTRITITPHIAAIGLASDAAPQVVENILRTLKGKPLVNQIYRQLGY